MEKDTRRGAAARDATKCITNSPPHAAARGRSGRRQRDPPMGETRVYYLKQIAHGGIGSRKGRGRERSRDKDGIAVETRERERETDNRPAKSTARGERGENVCSFVHSFVRSITGSSRAVICARFCLYPLLSHSLSFSLPFFFPPHTRIGIKGT